MALNSGKILMRRGQEVNFDPNKMTPGEWAVSLDSKYVRMCFSPGVCVRMATYDAFEADMVQIQRILAECQTVEEAVQRIYEEIKDVAVDVERIETAAASALESEENALNSANLAVQSANTATQKAEEAEESANIASTKAEQATEGANTATQKASEAAESAGNVRNMSEVSQSYAVGGTGIREGEDTDNAKYYNQQASDNADRAEEAAERASAVADVGVATTEKAGLVRPDGETIRVDLDGTIHADRGTTSYTDLENKPTINDVELNGNKTLDELGIASKEALEKTDSKVNIIIEQAELRFKETASGEHIHLDDSADSKLVEFELYGKSRQDGTPTQQNPIDIEVAGSSGNVEVKSIGKNLLSYPYHETTHEESGVTYTDKGNGEILVNGTNTKTGGFSEFQLIVGASFFNEFQDGNYILSGCPSGGNADTYRVMFTIQQNGAWNIGCIDYGSGGTFTINQEEVPKWQNAIINIRVYGTANNLTFKPMIRLASDTDSTYEPYKSKTATIPTENGLAGIPVESGGNYTDSNGQQWICDEIAKYADGSGEYVQRIGKEVFDGSEDEAWKTTSSNEDGVYRVLTEKLNGVIKKTNDTTIQAAVLSSQFVKKSASETWRQGDGISVYTDGKLIIYSNKYNTNDISLWKNHLSENPMEVLFELANSIRTPLTAEQLAEIEKLSTFYPVTNMSNDADCGMKVKYIADAKSYIDNRLALIEQAVLNSI